MVKQEFFQWILLVSMSLRFLSDLIHALVGRDAKKPSGNAWVAFEVFSFIGYLIILRNAGALTLILK